MLIARDKPPEEQIREALDACAREPIHRPGAIQPHGYLVAVSSQGKIENISANAEALFGVTPEQCLGRNITDFIPFVVFAALQSRKSEGDLQPIVAVRLDIGGKSYNAIANMNATQLIIEIEPEVELLPSQKNGPALLQSYATEIQRLSTHDALFDQAVRAIRQLTGFARVKLYRFDEMWNGEVVAESRDAHMPSYKGLHFPASDIPEQARRLYMKNFLHLIVDTAYKPAPIIPDTNPRDGEPLDLSLCALRSVSPVHIQYLYKIDIRASMSISILQGGKLWGLIACHHNLPLQIPHAIRGLCEIIGHIFSARLSVLEETERQTAQQARELLVQRLSTTLAANPRMDAFLQESHEEALAALEADGLAHWSPTGISLYGETPSREACAVLTMWLRSNDPRHLYQTRDAATAFKNIATLDDLQGGVLATPISKIGSEYIIWFRNPIVSEVLWAGDPEKPAEDTIGGYRLTTRSSFELWKQEIRHCSRPWSIEAVRTRKQWPTSCSKAGALKAQQSILPKQNFLPT